MLLWLLKASERTHVCQPVPMADLCWLIRDVSV